MQPDHAVPITIRPARLDDERFVMALTTRLADFPLPSWRTADEIARGDRPILLDTLHGRLDGAVILVAEDTRAADAPAEPAGYVFATTRHDYFTHARHAHVEVLAVAPEAEGRGVASALMSAVEQWSRDQGFGFITLNVFTTNTRARSLYERLGYEPETLHYRKDTGPVS